METPDTSSTAIERWVEANHEAAARALSAAARPLHALLGGEADPQRERETLAAEVARMRLSWRPSSTDATE
jgi:hypothetical protein